ncbi:hypothetical protein AVEN_108141-1 [Araneus ventricosus]|uniref:Uncharacterized protein n=1 Tax=Araneus ventricosus TaxID=182803 RepID=A0A4Y2P9T0_ARAVE|nr:hypothetical protein AVEN_95358-1 [Araneus ventricosus]GBN47200.1 hypothetical protein AVEN_108141-1 [Araneus ventricosus]
MTRMASELALPLHTSGRTLGPLKYDTNAKFRDKKRICPFFFKNKERERRQKLMELLLLVEVVNLAKQLDLDVDRNDIYEMLDSHSRELNVDELSETHEQVTSVDAATSNPDPQKNKYRLQAR